MLNEEVLEKIVNMIKSININLGLIQEINNYDLNQSVTPSFLTQWLKEELKKMADIYNEENLKNNNDYKYLGFVINKIDSFVQNFKIDDPELDKKIKEIKNTNSELLRKLKPSIYDYYFENLSKIVNILENLVNRGFLDEEVIDIENLNKYNKALSEYEKLLEETDMISSEINEFDKFNLNELLEKNLEKINNNFKSILFNILENDSLSLTDQDRYFKLKQIIEKEGYDYILNRNIINFEIISGDIRNELNDELKSLVAELREIYDLYKSKKLDRSHLEIDITLNDKPASKRDYNIEIPNFINEAYDKKKKQKLENFQNRADNLESEYIKEGKLTIGMLKVLKKLRSKITKEQGSKTNLISNFRFRKELTTSKIQRKNPHLYIKNSNSNNKKL